MEIETHFSLSPKHCDFHCIKMDGDSEHFQLVPPYFTPDRKDVPVGRSGHSMCTTETELIVFGGYSQADERNGLTENTVFPELWRYNFAQQKWTRFNVSNTQTTCLSSCMILQNRTLFVFGGTGYPFAQDKSNSLRMLSLPLTSRLKPQSDKEYQWTDMEDSPTDNEDMSEYEYLMSIPPPDYGQSMILHQNTIFIFGGTAGFYNDDAKAKLFCFDLDTREWTKLKPTGSVPCGRYKQEVFQDSENFYVLGGGRLHRSEGLDQIYRYNFVQNHWSIIPSVPDAKHGFPKSRSSFGCSKEKDNIYISGGRHHTEINNFQELDDIWHLRLGTFQWTRISFNLPEKLFFHRTVVTPSGSMYMFGGVLADGLRSAKLHRMRLPFSVGKLTEMCWERVCDLINQNQEVTSDVLVSQGVPWNFIERINPSPA